MQVVCTQHIPKSSLCQQSRGMMSILHVRDGNCCVGYPVVDNRIHRDSHGIFGQNLLGRDVKGQGSQIDLRIVFNAG